MPASLVEAEEALEKRYSGTKHLITNKGKLLTMIETYDEVLRLKKLLQVSLDGETRKGTRLM